LCIYVYACACVLCVWCICVPLWVHLIAYSAHVCEVCTCTCTFTWSERKRHESGEVYYVCTCASCVSYMCTCASCKCVLHVHVCVLFVCVDETGAVCCVSVCVCTCACCACVWMNLARCVMCLRVHVCCVCACVLCVCMNGWGAGGCQVARGAFMLYTSGPATLSHNALSWWVCQQTPAASTLGSLWKQHCDLADLISGRSLNTAGYPLQALPMLALCHTPAHFCVGNPNLGYSWDLRVSGMPLAWVWHELWPSHSFLREATYLADAQTITAS